MLENKNKVFSREDLKSNKYLVETILLDDVLEYIPKNSKNENYKKAIIKIDIVEKQLLLLYAWMIYLDCEPEREMYKKFKQNSNNTQTKLRTE